MKCSRLFVRLFTVIWRCACSFLSGLDASNERLRRFSSGLPSVQLNAVDVIVSTNEEAASKVANGFRCMIVYPSSALCASLSLSLFLSVCLACSPLPSPSSLSLSNSSSSFLPTYLSRYPPLSLCLSLSRSLVVVSVAYASHALRYSNLPEATSVSRWRDSNFVEGLSVACGLQHAAICNLFSTESNSHCSPLLSAVRS